MKNRSTAYLVTRAIARLITAAFLIWITLLGFQAFWVLLWSFS